MGGGNRKICNKVINIAKTMLITNKNQFINTLLEGTVKKTKKDPPKGFGRSFKKQTI